LPGRFLRTFEPVMRLMPEVKSPERRVGFNEKVFWTGMALILYLIMAEVPLFGLAARGPDNLYIRVIFASNQGTLMELGIGPIVTAGLILQMLAGSGFIDVDFSDPEDRSLFTGASKIFSIVLTGFQASAYLVGGLFGSMDPTQSIIVFFQLLTAGVILMLLDEMIQKGWGIGSGISLFILAGVAQRIVGDCFSVIPVGGGEAEPMRNHGIISALVQNLFQGNDLSPLVTSASGYPDMTGLLTTIVVFLFVIYAQGIRVELPISHARFRGFRGKYPISLLYVSNLPVIFASALFGNVILWSQLLWNNYQNSEWAWLIKYLGEFATEDSRSVPVGGLAYYVTAPTRGILEVMADPLRYSIYALVLIAFCIVFSVIWLEVGGLDPRTVAQQLVDSGMQIPGFRRSGRPIETILKRYIPIVTVLGGLIVGLLAALADFFGAFGTGTGILLSVGIVYQYYQQLMQERIEDMYPGLRRFLGG